MDQDPQLWTAQRWLQVAAGNNPHGWPVLHLAVLGRASGEVVQQILEGDPQRAQQTDRRGRLALYWAVTKQAPATVVQALLDAHPAAASSEDGEGRLPLHLAVIYNAPADVIGALVRRYPWAATTLDRQRRLPLHWAALNGGPVETVNFLLEGELGPLTAASVADAEGRRPLNLAAMNEAPVAVIRALLITPEAADSVRGDDELPALYTAVKDEEGVDIIRSLLQQTPPEALRVRDKGGRTPLHMAVMRDDLVVVNLLASRATAAMIEFHDRSFPLHLACEFGAPVQVVRALSALHPAAAGKADCQGRLPLHLACGCGAPVEVVKALERLRPAAALTPDSNGHFPLDHAVHSRAPEEVMTAVFPIMRRPSHTVYLEWLPFRLAVHLRSSLEAVRGLLAMAAASPNSPKFCRAFLDVAEVHVETLTNCLAGEWGVSGETVEALLRKIVRFNRHRTRMRIRQPLHDAVSCRAPLEIVALLLQLDPEVAGTADHRGRLPLQLACCGDAPQVEVIRALMSHYPPATSAADVSGQLPLHFAAANPAGSEAVRCLLEDNRSAVTVKNREDCIPLHLAVKCRAPVGTIRALVEFNQETASIPGPGGKSPLHLAVDAKYVGAVTVLLEVHKGAAKTVDGAGRLPLQLAADVAVWYESIAKAPDCPPDGAQSAADIIEALLEAYPDAVGRLDHRNLSNLIRDPLWTKGMRVLVLAYRRLLYGV